MKMCLKCIYVKSKLNFIFIIDFVLVNSKVVSFFICDVIR